jgi:hypothetical protein
MKDRVKNLIIIGLILSLSISFYYNYIKNKDEDDVNNAKTTKQENNQIPNNDIENVDENIEINPEPEEINLPEKAGSIRYIKTIRPIREIIYFNLTFEENKELGKYFSIISAIDLNISDIMNEYNRLSKENINAYNVNAINVLNKIFVVQDVIIDDIEILDYVDCYDMLADIYAKNIIIQNLIDAHIANDVDKINELEKTFYIIVEKHSKEMIRIFDKLEANLK